MVIRLLICIFLLQGCFPKKALKPEDALKEYIVYRFSPGQTREKNLELTTGEARARVESLTDEQFKKYISTGVYRLKNIKVVLKSCAATKCSITYILSYNKKEGESQLSEIKKIAELEQIEGSWKIKDVSTVKTYFESDVPIDVP
jgi:hypothetical protein